MYDEYLDLVCEDCKARLIALSVDDILGKPKSLATMRKLSSRWREYSKALCPECMELIIRRKHQSIYSGSYGTNSHK